MDTITLPTGLISATNYYSSEEVKKLLGIKQYALRTMRKNGLTYTKVGYGFLYNGGDIIRYLQNNKSKRGQ